ncbi:GvpL/GvpF family gas vesicle protein [Nocardioides sp. CER19]|uniref:GvpL/GvpF family gas vesicle protein n=1 Tax=Nocardioides sp. CER19 TaxID=3038538 RepID=UPI002447585B|nr:GvpL/GvpF family gas vesicle protein [Nocardioides sp. CER19]MDH2415878.1 GvpL/GvpF family gas vesicle protein [Nocardioides sp. CER19]
MSEGRYLYAVTRDLSPDAVAGTRALGGSPLEVIEHRGLSVLVSTVDLDEFGEDALRRNLEDLAWLEATARGHDDVVRFAAERGATAPMRLVTICLDDAGVLARLDDSYDQIVQALARVEGRTEWSVKAFAPTAAAEERATAVGAGGGAAYLRARKAAVEGRRAQDEAAMATAEELHDVLSRLAVASRRLPPQDPRLSGHEGRMTLNAAYLVDEADGDAFAREVERLAREHPDARVSAGGPWPPYSFATLEDA